MPAFTFKTSEADFYFLTDEPSFKPTPYMASRGMKWVQQFDPSELPDEVLKEHLRESHLIVHWV